MRNQSPPLEMYDSLLFVPVASLSVQNFSKFINGMKSTTLIKPFVPAAPLSGQNFSRFHLTDEIY